MTTEQLSALENQLREKEQLVSALTERLEQAAEQLDRIRRTGGDRTIRGGGAGIPPELIEDQKHLVGELQQAVQQWSDMQPGATLGRIEVQIIELRDLVARKMPEGALDSMPRGQNGSHSESSSSERHRGGGPPRNGAMSAYESMKASLMGTEAPAPEPQPEKPVAKAPQSIPKQEEITPVDPPAKIELEAAGIEDLRKAVEERDTYISFLIKKLRAAEMCNQESVDWEALNNAPEDLRRRLEDLEKTLHATLRHAEIDHSLERARLARESTRLEQMDEQIRREMKRLDISDRKSDGDEEHAVTQDAGMNSRWQRLFGKK